MTFERARCACGDFVLDGHLTCGRLGCNEAAARDRRDEAFRRDQLVANHMAAFRVVAELDPAFAEEIAVWTHLLTLVDHATAAELVVVMAARAERRRFER